MSLQFIFPIPLAGMVAFLLFAGVTQGYVFTPLAVPGPNSTQTNAFGLNDEGVVVGTYRDGTTTRGFRYESGGYATVNVGSSSTFLRSINNSGAMAGASRVSSTVRDGFIRATSGPDVVFQVLNPAGFTLPYAINDTGEVVGGSVVGAGSQSAFIRTATEVISFSVPNASNTYAYAINNSGQIAGTYNPEAGGVASFLRGRDGAITLLSIPGLDEPTVFGINDSGVVVGANEQDGFIYDGTTVQIVNFPGATRTTITDINNAGSIVGIYEANGVTQSFLAVVPEPGSAFSIVSVACSGLACGRMRRRKMS